MSESTNDPQIMNDEYTPDLMVFGGAFDPPHLGHVECLRAAARRFPAAALLVIPAFVPPGLSDEPKAPLASYEHRLAMVRLLFSREIGPEIEVSTLESHLPTPSYTLQTLRALREREDNKKIVLLIGQDQLGGFHKWKNPQEILSLVSLLVVRRESVQQAYGGNLRNLIEGMTAAIGGSLEWDAGRQGARIEPFGTRIDMINVAPIPAESRMIRNFISNKRPLPAGWIPPYLAEYIDHYQLYRGNQNVEYGNRALGSPSSP